MDKEIKKAIKLLENKGYYVIKPTLKQIRKAAANKGYVVEEDITGETLSERSIEILME